MNLLAGHSLSGRTVFRVGLIRVLGESSSLARLECKQPFFGRWDTEIGEFQYHFHTSPRSCIKISRFLKLFCGKKLVRSQHFVIISMLANPVFKHQTVNFVFPLLHRWHQHCPGANTSNVRPSFCDLKLISLRQCTRPQIIYRTDCFGILLWRPFEPSRTFCFPFDLLFASLLIRLLHFVFLYFFTCFSHALLLITVLRQELLCKTRSLFFKCFYQRANEHISRFADMLFATKVGGTPAARVRMLNRYQINGKSRGPEFILK